MRSTRSDRINMTGLVYGRLTVMADAGRRGKYSIWSCRCECGKTVVVRGDKMRNGWTQSCGCLHDERWSQLTHGHSRVGKWSPTYRSWVAAKTRCACPTAHEYRYYGGRGIMMCKEWRDSFEQFLADMGPRPTRKHSIERIDNNRNYEPSNCRWATQLEQANNKRNNPRFTHNGKTLTVGEWARVAGIPSGVMYMRLVKLKWTVSRALTQPIRPDTADPEKRDSTIRRRFKQGTTTEKLYKKFGRHVVDGVIRAGIAH